MHNRSHQVRAPVPSSHLPPPSLLPAQPFPCALEPIIHCPYPLSTLPLALVPSLTTPTPPLLQPPMAYLLPYLLFLTPYFLPLLLTPYLYPPPSPPPSPVTLLLEITLYYKTVSFASLPVLLARG